MSLPQTPFWYLRHGQTDYNARRLAQGAIEVPLNETGRAQARDAAPLLANRGITAIHCSPMLRARQTAEIVNETLALPIHYDDELREVIFGEKEGQPLGDWFTDWMDDSYTPANGESFSVLTRRIETALHRLLVHPDPILIVAHGALFRAIRGLMGISRDGFTPNGQPFYCEPADGAWQIQT